MGSKESKRGKGRKVLVIFKASLGDTKQNPGAKIIIDKMGKKNKINRGGSFILSFKESIKNNGELRKVSVQVCYSTMSF